MECLHTWSGIVESCDRCGEHRPPLDAYLPDDDGLPTFWVKLGEFDSDEPFDFEAKVREFHDYVAEKYPNMKITTLGPYTLD